MIRSCNVGQPHDISRRLEKLLSELLAGRAKTRRIRQSRIAAPCRELSVLEAELSFARRVAEMYADRNLPNER